MRVECPNCHEDLWCNMCGEPYETTTAPLTADDLRAAAKKMFDTPMQPDLYQDSPAMRKALGIDDA